MQEPEDELTAYGKFAEAVNDLFEHILEELFLPILETLNGWTQATIETVDKAWVELREAILGPD